MGQMRGGVDWGYKKADLALAQLLLCDWLDKALCGEPEYDRIDFHPESWRPGYWSKVKTAQMVCDKCPVKLDCREFARSTREEMGIWGGETPDQRKKANSELRWAR